MKTEEEIRQHLKEQRELFKTAYRLNCENITLQSREAISVLEWILED